MTVQSTLGRRGYELASGPNIRDKFKTILSDPYDPDTNPGGFINIGVAENYAMIPDVRDFTNKNLSLSYSDFTYGEGPWGTKRLREAMAKHMNGTFNPLTPVDPEKLLFANGCTSIFEMLGFSVCDPGDGLLLPRPIYQAFQIDFGLKAKVKSIYTDFGDVDQFSPEAIAKYEDAILQAESSGVHVRVFMLCNPHNPLGQCYPKETIIGIMKLCEKYKIHLISDEIYASSVYDVPDENAVPFTSALSFDTSKYISSDYLHVVYGMSKDFGAGGTRLGCIYLRNKELMRAMSSITQFHWSGGPSEKIATTMLEDEKWLNDFLERGRRRLSERNKLTRKLLDDAGIDYHRGANAGFFMWIDLRPYLPESTDPDNVWLREEALVKQLIDNKVFLTNGQELGSPEPGWFRVIFSQDERVITTGLRRVFKTIGKS